MATPTQWRATLKELFIRKEPLNKENSKEVYWNGENNLYPNEVERVILNSPTGARAASMLAKFIAGVGVTDANDTEIPYENLPVVNKKHGYRITDIISQAAVSIARQSGVFIHVGYSIDESTGGFKQSSLTVLDYTKCRIAKKDDDDNAGKIYVKDFEKKEKIGGGKKETPWYYPYNSDANVVRSQIMADADKKEYDPMDLARYRGQVLYLNLTPEFQYALSRFDPVYNDMDTEYRMGLYTNTETRLGFLGKTIFLLQGLDDEQADKVKNDLGELMGADGGGNLLTIDIAQADDITKVLHPIQLKAQFDDKMFEATQKRIRTNILGAANNIPEPLVYASEGALFGTQADTYTEMKRFYSEQTQAERDKLEGALSRLGFPYKIIPIVDPNQQSNVSE